MTEIHLRWLEIGHTSNWKPKRDVLAYHSVFFSLLPVPHVKFPALHSLMQYAVIPLQLEYCLKHDSACELHYVSQKNILYSDGGSHVTCLRKLAGRRLHSGGPHHWKRSVCLWLMTGRDAAFETSGVSSTSETLDGVWHNVLAVNEPLLIFIVFLVSMDTVPGHWAPWRSFVPLFQIWVRLVEHTREVSVDV